jgi:hypothetical protein
MKGKYVEIQHEIFVKYIEKTAEFYYDYKNDYSKTTQFFWHEIFINERDFCRKSA